MSLLIRQLGEVFSTAVDGPLTLGCGPSVVYRLTPKSQSDYYDSLKLTREDGSVVELLFEGYYFDETATTGVSAAFALIQIADAIRNGDLQPLRKLNGVYNCVVLFDGGRELVLFNDRSGLLPLYENPHSQFDKVFSSRMKDFVSLPEVGVDMKSVCQFSHYEFCLDERTLLKSVTRLPGGSVVHLVSGIEKLRKRYFEFQKVEELSAHPDVLCESLHASLSGVIGKISTIPSDIAVTLSGGLDSRTIAAYLSSASRDFYSLNVAVGRNTRERDYSKQLAKLCKSEWYSARFRELPLKDSIESNWSRFACAISYNQCWTTPVVREFSRRVDDFVILDGLCLDVQLGETFSSVKPDSLKQLSDSLHFTFGGLTQGEINSFMHHSLKEECERVKGSDLAESLESRFNKSRDLWWTSRLFTFENRIRNYTVGLPISNSSLATTFFPFYDYAFFDLCLAIPRKLLADRFLHRLLLKSYFAPFAAIPWTKTGKPPAVDTAPSIISPVLEDWYWRISAKLGLFPKDTLEGYMVSNDKLITFVSDLVSDASTKYQILSKKGAETLKSELRKGVNVRRALSFAQLSYLFGLISVSRSDSISLQ